MRLHYRSDCYLFVVVDAAIEFGRQKVLSKMMCADD